MKSFTFKVKQTDIFISEITITAETEEEARTILEQELEEEPLDQRKNTLDESYINVNLVGIVS